MADDQEYIETPDVEMEDEFEATRLLQMDNIAEDLDDDLLMEIGKEVVRGYDIDEKSRSEWLDRYESWINLAMQAIEKKNFPWPNASNVKYPLLTQAAISFQARIYPALLSGPKIVKGRVIGKDPSGDKLRSAIRIETHMSYQVLEQMEEWEEEMDRLTLILPIVGCVFKKSYYSEMLRRNVSEVVLPHDLCVDYYAKNLDTARRVTHVLELSRNDLYERMKGGVYLDVELGTTEQYSESRARRRRVQESQSKKSPPAGEDQKNIPREILEQHTFYDLDGDGYEEPYIITVDLQSKKVLRIVARYEAGDIERTADGDVLRITPAQYFTKYSFVPSPDGSFYDVGFGLLLGSLNESINTAINQLFDAGTLSNMQSGFIGRGLRIRGGKRRFHPGEWKVANASGQKLKENIVPLPVREPSTVLFSLLGMLVESGERLASIVDSLTGENPGQNQKATTTLAVIEQGLKVFSSIQKRCYRSLKSEFKKLHNLNSIYLEPREYYDVLDDPEAEQQEVYRTDYQNDRTDVIPFADPNVSSESQRLIKAQALLELQQMGFNLNPEIVKRRVLEAQNQQDIEELMDVPEPPPSLEQLQHDLEKERLQHEIEKDLWELKIREREVESKEADNEAKALLNTMKAQTEAGQSRLNEIDRMLQVIMTSMQTSASNTGGNSDRGSSQTGRPSE